MTGFVALLRAVNVGGTGKLPMADLRAIAARAGFRQVQTYIASGNLVFDYKGTATEAQAILQELLADTMGKSVGALIRDAAQMARIVADNPFADAPPAHIVALFLDAAPPCDAVDQAVGVNGEVIALGRREIYVHYVHGQAVSKLRIPAAAAGTARNMNTVRKLAEMVGNGDNGR